VGGAGSCKPKGPSLELLDDQSLVELARGGSDPAFTAIWQRHYRRLHNYCRTIVGDAEDAHDAVQNTMLKAFRALPDTGGVVNLRAWLRRIAHNEAISLLRTQTCHEQIDHARELSDKDMSFQAREYVASLLGELKQLSERQQQALILREICGLDFAEIGARFDISSKSAKQAVYEARNTLKQRLNAQTTACETIESVLSAGDGRTSQSIKVKAHLRLCKRCRNFESALKHAKGAGALVPLAPTALRQALKKAPSQAKGLFRAKVALASSVTAGLGPLLCTTALVFTNSQPLASQTPKPQLTHPNDNKGRISVQITSTARGQSRSVEQWPQAGVPKSGAIEVSQTVQDLLPQANQLSQCAHRVANDTVVLGHSVEYSVTTTASTSPQTDHHPHRGFDKPNPTVPAKVVTLPR
jgi:RNA polymerase sigma factor (sigma-70 family)